MSCSCQTTIPVMPKPEPACSCRAQEPPAQTPPCSCGVQSAPPAPARQPESAARLVAKGLAALALWLAAWFSVLPLSRLLAHELFGLPETSGPGKALQFFLYDTPKILLLLALMIYLMAWFRAGLNTDRLRDFLAGRGRGLGYVLAAVFGAISPFCSCSSVPLFIGFASTRIPIGIIMAFLITSPVINEVAVVLLWGLLGWKFTLLYVSVGMIAGIVGGLFMDAIHAERWLQAFLLEPQTKPQLRILPMHGVASARVCATVDIFARHTFARAETAKIFRKVWLWVIVGVGIGAGLHGFVPENWFAVHLGAGQWWSVPAAVALGIPLYANVTGVVPVMASLLAKGLPVGTTLAFCLSSVAASLPELIMLKQVMRPQLLAAFLGFLWLVFTLTGWLFNALF